MNKLHFFAAWAMLAGVVLGCKDKETPLPLAEEQDIAIQEYIAEHEIDSAEKSNDDFYYYPLTEGGSIPNSNNIISFYYTVKDLTGDVKASHTAGDGDPIKAERETSTIYPPGLDQALQMLATGDKYVFLFPSHKAYGSLDWALPANSIAVIEIEIVAEQSINQIRQEELQQFNDYISDFKIANYPDTVITLPSGLSIIKTKEDTTAAAVPASGEVTINWNGKFLSGDPFGNEDGFVVSMGGDEVIEGLEAGLSQMRLGEVAQLLIPSGMAYGPSVQSVPHNNADFIGKLVENQIIPDYGAVIPPFTPLIFEVRVVEF
jgi:FKBP-type peptidyl-prolyl cis-trans isomerase